MSKNSHTENTSNVISLELEREARRPKEFVSIGEVAAEIMRRLAAQRSKDVGSGS